MSCETTFPTTNQSCRDGEMTTAGCVQGTGLQEIVVAEVAIVFGETFVVDDPYELSQTLRPISLSLTMEQHLAPRKTSLIPSVRLPKKTSIPSLFAASSPQQPSSTETSTHPLTSPSRVPQNSFVNFHSSSGTLPEPSLLQLPPPSLLDNDPFTSLTRYGIPQLSNSPTSFERPSLSQVPPPSIVVVSPQVHVPRPTVARPRSSGHAQARPAHTKPAFALRPSLPSLHALAQMNIPTPGKKVRKGTPGARLPHEPWDMNLSAEFNLLTRNIPSTAGPPDNQPSCSQPPLQETTVQTELISLQTAANSETCFVSQEIGINSPSLGDETSSSRSFSGDDADADSLPSLSYTTSEPSSSALSRSSSVASSTWLEGSMDTDSSRDTPNQTSMSFQGDEITEEDDPLSYHSDFDYYTQSLSDLSDSEPDVDPTTGGKPPLDVGSTTYTSVYDPVVDIEPGIPADTMRRVSVHREHTQTDTQAIGSPKFESPQDGGGWRGQQREPERQSDRGDERRGRESSRRNGGYSGGQSSGAYGGGAGGDDNNEDKPQGGKSRLSDSSTSDFTSSSDDDADGITVYYSLDGMSNGPRSRSHSRIRSRYPKAGGGSDDDVPLAQRVPTALSAQKSIRRQLRDERQQRKLERVKSSRTAANPPLSARPTESHRAPAAPTGLRKRSTSAAPAPMSRPRATPTETFPIDDLTRKLVNLQTSSRAPPSTAPLTYDGSTPTNPPPRVPVYGVGVSRSSSRARYADQTTYLQQKASRVPEASSQDRPLKSMRSFHRPDGRYSETQRTSVEQTSTPRLARSTTTTTPTRIIRAGRDTAAAGYEQHAKSGRVSEDGRRPSASIPRPSLDKESDVVQRAVQRTPVPPLPISDSTPPQPMSRVSVVQQRIFIGDMQRFNMVEITPTTNAGDVIDAVASQGMLDRSGSWILFEMAQDYGMERPIRDYELLADVSASWNKDKLLNAFVIKQTPLAQLLSRSAIPTSSPTHRGWVEWESKRGKWSKRWMELREHGLWLSKRDTGKDEVFLCSLSNFDAYCVTRRHKSPKSFVFAIKSTDHLSLFENAADYLHVFSCNPKDGEKWMQVILVARSYVLYQERHVLFAKTGESLSQVKPLTRSRTRKPSVSARPAQPLVNVPPPFSQSQTANVAFEPGSLLAKRKGDT